MKSYAVYRRASTAMTFSDLESHLQLCNTNSLFCIHFLFFCMLAVCTCRHICSFLPHILYLPNFCTRDFES